MLDATSPSPTAPSEDTGAEAGTLSMSGSLRGAGLPPAGSPDRLLMSLGSRLVYPLTSIVLANALSPAEMAFIARPTGGPCVFRTAVACAFPALPDYGCDAAPTAAALLRSLWMRLPLLRAAIAHIAAVTALATAQMLGPVHVSIQRPPQRPAAAGALAPAEEPLSVTVPADVVLSRFLGVALDRLQHDAAGGAATAAARRRLNCGAHALHPLVSAVQARLANSSLCRADGVVLLGSIDVEEYDETLC